METLAPVKRYVSSTGVRIYRISCQVYPDLTARVYLLLGAGAATLVDTGSGRGDSTAQILAGLESVRRDFGEAFRVSDLGRILISHAHLDHFGGAADLLEHCDARVLVHPLDGGPVGSWEEHAVVARRRMAEFFMHAGADRQLAAQLCADSRYDRQRLRAVPIGGWLADGQDLDGLRVIHTPGHSPGMVCIAVGDIFLSSDHILSKTIPQQWPEQLMPYTGLGHYLDSLERVARLGEFAVTLPAHEEPIKSLLRRIAVIRESHQRRLDRLQAILHLAERPLSVLEISRKLYGEATGFRAVLAITDTGSRVEYLHQRGKLAVANLDEVEQSDMPAFRYVWREWTMDN